MIRVYLDGKKKRVRLSSDELDRMLSSIIKEGELKDIDPRKEYSEC